MSCPGWLLGLKVFAKYMLLNERNAEWQNVFNFNQNIHWITLSEFNNPSGKANNWSANQPNKIDNTPILESKSHFFNHDESADSEIREQG